jgi:type IV pilus assembly protein PilC
MAEFVCKVADASGRISSQVEVAQNVGEARQKLSDRGLYVYSVRARIGLLGRSLGQRRDRAVKSGDFLIFNQQFNTLIKAGLPILKALDLLAERAASPRLRPALVDVRNRVREGASLSEALEQQGGFPRVYVTAVLAGEKSGNLTGVLDYYIAYQKVSTGIKKKLIATLVYPIILISVASMIVTYLVTYVVPQFAKLYSDMQIQLPAVTRLLVTLTVTYRPYVAGAAALFFATVISVVLWSRSEAGGFAMDRLKLKIPVVGDTWIKFQVAQFCRTLSTLLAGGTPLVGALATSADSVRSRLISGGIKQASELVRDGQSLHKALASTGLMPGMGLEMIEVGEASGALSPMLGSIAEFYEEETNLRLATLIAVVEPAILVFMAIVIAFILISLYLPIFSFSAGGGPG